MIQTRKIGSLIEVYITGGGKYLTESYPTNHHNPYKQKILVGNETIDDFREVTVAEWQAIKAEDAKWTEPSQDLIDRAEAAGVVYNRATGYFERNGLKDITAEQMLVILEWGKFDLDAYGAGSIDGADTAKMFRTNILAVRPDKLRYDTTLNHLCYGQSQLEVFVLGMRSDADYTYSCSPTSISEAFSRCGKLTEIMGVINLDLIGSTTADRLFGVCSKLQTVHFHRIKTNLNLAGCPELSCGSFAEMVRFAINTEPISIEVHPDVYAKLSNTDAAAYVPENLLTKTQNAEWTDVFLGRYENALAYKLGLSSIGLKTGDVCTVSCEVKSAGNKKELHLYIWADSTSGKRVLTAYSNKIAIGESGLAVVTFTIPSGITEFNIALSNYTSNTITEATTEQYKGLKLEFGENASPVWTPALSEIADAELREKAEWASVMQMARARQISFVTNE